VIASADTIASAERSERVTCGRADRATVRAPSAIDPYDTDVADENAGPSTGAGIDVDPRSAIPLAVAFATLATVVWFVRSVPRTITALAIGALIALALNPLVEALQHRTSWPRRYAASIVLVGFSIVFVVGVALVTVPTIRQVQGIDEDIPEVVDDLESLPIVGDRLREENASDEVEQWLDDLPDRLSVDAKPVERALGSVADGLAAAFLTLLLAITLLIDGEQLLASARRIVPQSRRETAQRLGALVYQVIGRYIAGSLLVAVLAGTVILIASLALGLPLAPLLGVWVAMTNMIPQIGGLLGAVPFVLLGFTQGAGTGVACLAIFLIYQNVENHLLQPVIVGRAVKLSPPATMIAALIGVSAGGVVGALFAVPILGASKAIYLALRERAPPVAAGGPPLKNPR
jgi:predicted PurR-regulated permease PerM